MRITHPSAENEIGRSLRRQRRRWDDADNFSLALGCVGCLDRETCGGIHKRQDGYSCLDDCCGNPGTCDSVCPRNLSTFIQRTREMNGFDLGNVARAQQRTALGFPLYIPLIYHGNRRVEPLRIPVAALPLHEIYSRRDGRLHYRSRAEIAAEFRLSEDTRIVLIGSGRDKSIEAWWGLSSQRNEAIAALRELGIELVTSPNYSLFTDQPRYDDMYNIKRIAVVWQEFLAGGVSCALHLNARTKRDYERFAAFIQERDEITEVSFEFATGAAWPGRREFHHRQLAQLAQVVQRPLHLFMVGGLPAVPTLAPAYDQLTYIDTHAFMSAVYRQRLAEGDDLKLTKASEMTEEGAPIDALVASNIEVMRARVEKLISASQPKPLSDDSEPRLESPESAASAPAGQFSDLAVVR